MRPDSAFFFYREKEIVGKNLCFDLLINNFLFLIEPLNICQGSIKQQIGIFSSVVIVRTKVPDKK